MALGCGLGTQLPEVVGLEVGAVGDQPVGVAQLAFAHVIGRAGTDRLPLVVPGAQVFQEAAQRPVAVLAAGAAPRASRPDASRAASGSRRPCDKASPPCCRERAGSGRAAHRRPPGFSGRIEPSHFQATSLVLESRDHASARSTRRRPRARNGAAATDSHDSPAVVMSARKVVPASIEAWTLRIDRRAQRLLGSGPPLGDHMPQPARPRSLRRNPARPSGLELEVRVRIDKARHDRRRCPGRGRTVDRLTCRPRRSALARIVRQPSSIGGPSTG